MKGQISEQDYSLVIEILKTALRARPHIRKAIIGEELQALSEEEKAHEEFSPRVAIFYVGDPPTLPSLYLRFIGAEWPIAECVFHPYQVIYDFLTEARAHARRLFQSTAGEDEIESIAIDCASEMTLMMLDNIHKRMELFLESFPLEVISQWRIQNIQHLVQYHAERGNIKKEKKDPTLENLLGLYHSNILELWRLQGLRQEYQRKIRLPEEYDAVYKHWKRLSKLLSEEGWREYAKIGKFQDTPDDLLDKLEHSDRPDAATVAGRLSELAIEHAARRVGLIKKRGVSEAVIRQRKQGIRATGYTSAQLFLFLQEGRKLREQMKAIEDNPIEARLPFSVGQKPDHAQVQQAKAFKRKVKAAQDKIGKPFEQKDDSAQEEKS